MSILTHDNKDDRFQFWQLLDDKLMTDALRLKFVRQCSLKCQSKLKPKVIPLRDGTYTTNVAKIDLLGMVGQYGLDFTVALLDLVDFVRSIHK